MVGILPLSVIVDGYLLVHRAFAGKSSA